MNYEAMANDILHFFRSHSLSNVSLLGHSMYLHLLSFRRVLLTYHIRGGKVAMTVALSPGLPADAIENLIVADIAPSNAMLSTEFQGYVEAMNKIEQSKVNSRREAQDILAPYEPVRRQLLPRNEHAITHARPLIRTRLRARSFSPISTPPSSL
jgi:pimeloyl-ACP methyl ester carboxylesterase